MSSLRSSGRRRKPAGRPSTMHVNPGPWDSPAVIRRSVISAVAYLLWALRLTRAALAALCLTLAALAPLPLTMLTTFSS